MGESSIIALSYSKPEFIEWKKTLIIKNSGSSWISIIYFRDERKATNNKLKMKCVVVVEPMWNSGCYKFR